MSEKDGEVVILHEYLKTPLSIVRWEIRLSMALTDAIRAKLEYVKEFYMQKRFMKSEHSDGPVIECAVGMVARNWGKDY
jgi:hypothetical protein